MIEKFILYGVPLIIAVVLHEVAHGYVAYRLGDPTAKSLGRITLNPLKHVDPVMTLLLPGILILSGSPIIFGGAKPVPIDPRYFRNPRRGMVYVAAAGPAINIVLAAISYGALVSIDKAGLIEKLTPGMQLALVYLIIPWFALSFLTNLALAAFNLLPVPPLDGGRIAVGLLPRSLALALARLEPYGLLIIFALLYLGVVDSYLRPIIDFAIRRLQP